MYITLIIKKENNVHHIHFPAIFFINVYMVYLAAVPTVPKAWKSIVAQTS